MLDDMVVGVLALDLLLGLGTVLALQQERPARIVDGVVVDGEDDAGDQHADDDDDQRDQKGPSQRRPVLEQALPVPVELRSQAVLVLDAPRLAPVVVAVLAGDPCRLRRCRGCCWW
ncbi:hypothetical protein F4811DRAFT_272201 [Daldinia bambusicola]|nr:hypothetical protein F4811DRAFT_272201 [Daldinia bambusicola]